MSHHLFYPITLGTVELRNRIVMPAIATCYADNGGFVTDLLIQHYVNQAKGGPGLIVIEITSIAHTGKMFSNQLGIYKDDFIPKLKQLTNAINEVGVSKCFLQLHHGGRRAPSKANNGAQPVAPSAMATWGGEMPRELTLQEIEGLIEAFAQGARRARESGFDGVELHCAHGYLVSQFLSPLTNKRSDQYGGDLESRARFALQILKRIRQKVGQDYPIIAKISGSEFTKGGLNLRDAQKLVPMFEETNINAIEVSAGYKASSEEGYINTSVPTANVPMSMPRGYFVHLAEEVKKVAKVPVIAVGRLDEPSLAEKVIAEGKADLISVARGFLADPFFPSKVERKQYSDIRPCIACNTCSDTLWDELGLRCAVNAELGKAKEYQIKRATKPKKVLVVGGGPGGMEAARVAALRGHEVTLFEKKPYLGGNLITASAVSFKKDIRRFADYLSEQVHKAGVNILLGHEFNEKSTLIRNSDVIILATGATCQKPAIPGAERANATDVVSVLEGKAKVDNKVVIVGGGMVGCEAAVFLAEKGKEVTLVTRRNSDFSPSGGLAPDMEGIIRRWFLFELWPTLPISVIANSTFKEVTGEGLIVTDIEGKRRLIKGSTIVFATGMSPNNELSKKLQGKVPELYQIGDCVQPRKIIDAVHEAARIARLI